MESSGLDVHLFQFSVWYSLKVYIIFLVVVNSFDGCLDFKYEEIYFVYFVSYILYLLCDLDILRECRPARTPQRRVWIIVSHRKLIVVLVVCCYSFMLFLFSDDFFLNLLYIWKALLTIAHHRMQIFSVCPSSIQQASWSLQRFDSSEASGIRDCKISHETFKLSSTHWTKNSGTDDLQLFHTTRTNSIS